MFRLTVACEHIIGRGSQRSHKTKKNIRKYKLVHFVLRNCWQGISFKISEKYEYLGPPKIFENKKTWITDKNNKSIFTMFKTFKEFAKFTCLEPGIVTCTPHRAQTLSLQYLHSLPDPSVNFVLWQISQTFSSLIVTDCPVFRSTLFW